MPPKQTSYYLYSLPDNVRESLRPLEADTAVQIEQPPALSLTPSTDPDASVGIIQANARQLIQDGKFECTYCGTVQLKPDSNESDVRNHYKTDFHRYNIRRRQDGLAPLNEDDFEAKIGELNESISGSDSETGSDSDDVVRDLQKTHLGPVAEEDDDAATTRANSSPFALYLSDALESDKCLAVYKSALDKELVTAGRSLAALAKANPTGHSVLLLIGGGHFAGAVVSHQRTRDKPTPQNPFSNLKILAHKSFHRYTVRRKQGGSQSASDNARGKANSAGSSLRRYNEQAFEAEVRELLGSWRDYIGSAESIFIRAAGRQNRAILMNYEAAPISSKDTRLKTFPFTTRRPTAQELKRAWVEVTRVRVADIPKPESSTKKPTAKADKARASPTPPPQKKKAEPTVAEKQTDELVAFIKRSRVPKMSQYLKSQGLDSNFRLEPTDAYETTPTLLHYASSEGSAAVVTALLTNFKADPTVRNATGRRPFDLARDQKTKDAFQLARGSLGETAWDWDAAGVGPALTKAEIEERDAKEREANLQQRQREIEALDRAEAARKLERTVYKHGTGKKLSSAVATAPSAQSGLEGLSPEARMRLERERRARAAEARLRGLSK